VCECDKYHANVEKAKGRLTADPIAAMPDEAMTHNIHSIDALLHEATLSNGAVDSWLFVADGNKASLVAVVRFCF